VLLAVATAPPIAWLLLFIYGLNTSSGMVIYQTWIQRRIPDEMRGRVFTWLDVVGNVMKVISLGIGGYLAERFGVEVVYYIGGTLLAITGLTGIIALRDEWLEEPAPAPNS
jgi:MFS family permease